MDTEIRDIYVISDLHLGDFSNRDSFAKTPLKTKEGIEVDRIPQFRAFLDMVRKNNGSIVILGDLFEFWKASIGTVLSKNLDLLGELASFGDLTVILGNHDNDLSDFISNPSLRLQKSHPFFAKIQTGNYIDGTSDYTIMQKVFTRDDGHKLTIGFMHGHEVDVFNRNPQPAIGRVVTILAGLIQDVIGSPVLPESGKVVEEDLMDKIHQIPMMGAWTIIKSCFKGIGRFIPLVVSYVVVLLLSIFSLWKSGVLWPQIIMLLFVILLPISVAFLLKGTWRDAMTGFLGIFGELSEYMECWLKSMQKYGASSAKRDSESILSQREKIEKIRQENNCDLIVMGHTHQDDLGETICNSGNWVNFKPSFLKISPNGEIALYRWEATAEGIGKAVLRKKRASSGDIAVFEEFTNDRVGDLKS